MCLRKKLLGIVLVSMGTGALMVLFIPFWGFILALLIVLVGTLLICDR